MKKLLLLIGLLSVSFAYAMETNVSAGKGEAPDDYQPDCAAGAGGAGAASAAAATAATTVEDEAGETTITITFTDADAQSADSESRSLKRKYANCSQTLKEILEDCAGASELPVIPLETTAAAFDLLAQYWEHVHQISIAPDEATKKERQVALIEKLKEITDKTTLGNIITIADYLGIQPLIDCGLQAAHNQILAEVSFDDFMDERALLNYNPYNLNDNLNRQLTLLIITPFIEDTQYVFENNTEFRGDENQKSVSLFGEQFTCDSNKRVHQRYYSFGQTSVTLLERRGFQGPKVGYGELQSPDKPTIILGQFIDKRPWWPIRNCIISPNGQILVTFHYRYIHVWDISGNLLHTLKSPIHSTTHYGCFSPDGTKLLTIWNTNNDHDNYHFIDLYDIQSGKTLRTLKGHTHWIHSCTFSPDGKTILTASSDNTAKRWDSQTGICIGTISTPPSAESKPVLGYFGRDGKKILTISMLNDYKGKANLWKNCSQKTEFAKSRCTLPQALLFLYALYRNGLPICRHHTRYQAIYNSFNPELKPFIAPIIGSRHCQRCITENRAIFAGAAAAVAGAIWKAYQWYRR